MENELKGMRSAFHADLAAANNAEAVEAVRVRYLGQKSGRLTHLLKKLGGLSREERPRIGKLANTLKRELEKDLARRQSALSSSPSPAPSGLDVTLPGRPPAIAALHPITIVRQQLEKVFMSMGYSVEDGPHVETEFHNFEALNIPSDHPARDEQDSFFAGPGRVLRTHTSPVQIRTMLARKPPLKFVAPGMVFRRDAIDATHTPAFFQLEGMAVAETLSMADLKGTLTIFWKRLLGERVQVRFRPSYFPFVEPGAEVDISDGGEWIEIMGAGMVHPAVFEAVGYDPARYTGFAFGMGIDRIAKLKYNIQDLRLFWENDLVFLSQFRGADGP
ncbi:MAG: phenylalanine--tRNA ligase subunit alpha [Acidobacteriota bacterium]